MAARDAITLDPADAPIVADEASMSVGIGLARDIQDIVADPAPTGLQQLVGCRGGGYLRAALDEFLPAERAQGTPLYLLLDDISGTSLIAGFAWSRWTDGWKRRPGPPPDMEGVCIGFRPGSTALLENRRRHDEPPHPRGAAVGAPRRSATAGTGWPTCRRSRCAGRGASTCGVRAGSSTSTPGSRTAPATRGRIGWPCTSTASPPPPTPRR